MGKPEFAVRENLCRAFFLGRASSPWCTAKKNIRQKNCLQCVFTSTHDKEILCRAFFSWRTANIFSHHRTLPSATTVSLRVIFAVR
jgi:hypothetical protein